MLFELESTEIHKITFWGEGFPSPMRFWGFAPQRRPCVLPPPCRDDAVAPVSGDRKDPKATLLLIVSTKNEELSKFTQKFPNSNWILFILFQQELQSGENSQHQQVQDLSCADDIYPCLLAPCLFDGPRAGILESHGLPQSEEIVKYNAPVLLCGKFLESPLPGSGSSRIFQGCTLIFL